MNLMLKGVDENKLKLDFKMESKIVLFFILIILLFGCRKGTDYPINNEQKEENPEILEIPEIPVNYLQVPSSAYPTVQSAIDSSFDGDTVIVLPGIYKEVLDMKGKNITLASVYLLEENQKYIEATILDGKAEWSVINFNNGENENCVLNGFTLRNGAGIKYNSPYASPMRQGGGIYCWKSKPVLKNLIIRENTADWGSAIYCSQGSVTLDNILVTENKGSHALYFIHSSPRINNIRVEKNEGNGLATRECHTFTISNSRFLNNSRSGCFFDQGRTILINVLCADNKYWGVSANAAPTELKNCTLVNNGGGINVFETSSFIKNCIFWNESVEISLSVLISGWAEATVRYSDVKGNPSSYENEYYKLDYDSTNISLDPQFCDPENGDYHLQPGSPCLTASEDGWLIGAMGEGCSGE
ncbi:MAG TPA: hypothetical protein ENK44_14445 [Caldithrix abyssi]|uniref:Right handed beta helix domain-containing protein n=1 Tax=Caldithrix abyssi TaxID=187145 RepID=A0A7V4U4V4_CALAY|nr:hypothetical protein [Caldithrix abyssi]